MITPPPSGARAARPQVPPAAREIPRLAVRTPHASATRVEPPRRDEHRAAKSQLKERGCVRRGPAAAAQNPSGHPLETAASHGANPLRLVLRAHSRAPGKILATRDDSTKSWYRDIASLFLLCVHRVSVVNPPCPPSPFLRLFAFFAAIPFPALALTNSSALVIPAPAPVNTNAPALTDDIRKLKPPVDIADPWFWVWLILAVLAAAALGYLAWRWWQRRQAAAANLPPIPPQDRARIRLQQALDLLDQPKPFCVAVSDALRHYLEERFNFRAPERTTEEFVAELRATSLLNPEQKKILGEFLTHCDLVKFARHEPGRPELMDLHRAALRLIQETELLAPSEPPPLIPPPPVVPPPLPPAPLAPPVQP